MPLTNFKEAREIAKLGTINYTPVIVNLRKRMNTAKMLKGPLTTVVEANTVSRRKAKCTQKKCVGTKHSPAECFKKPGNEHLMQEWVAERQRMGLWHDQPTSSSSAEIPLTTQPSLSNHISVEALQA